MDSLNYMSDKGVIDAVGTKHLEQVHQLCRHVFHETEISYVYKMAPSLIVRSECELFGLSAPRFSIRKYVFERTVGRDGTTANTVRAVFNLRRLEWFANAINKCHGHFFDTSNDNAIADALIQPSALAFRTFYIMTAKLGAAYGLDNPDFAGVPFMQHTDIGGGLCAQACLFMSLCLLQEHCSGICGIADLTAIGKRASHSEPQERSDGANAISDLPIGKKTNRFAARGLFPDEMVRVLRSEHCGLSSFQEICGTLRVLPDHRRAAILASALRGYCLSDIPVTCLVKLSRVMGQHLPEHDRHHSIWNKNRLPQVSQSTMDALLNEESGSKQESELGNASEKKKHKSIHAILIVGCSMGRDTETHFLFNDPATFPLLDATAEELFDARTDEKMLELILAFPRGVEVPLLGIRLGTRIGGNGAIGCSYYAQIGPGASLHPYTRKTHSDWPGEWLLVDIEHPDSLRKLKRFGVIAEEVSRMREAVRAASRRLRMRSGWVWIQRLAERYTGCWERFHVSGLVPSCEQYWVWRADFIGSSSEVAEAQMLTQRVAIFRQRGHRLRTLFLS